MAQTDCITQAEVHELFDYEPDTGNLIWRVKRGRAGIGWKAGVKSQQGYIVIRIAGVSYRAHRLIWLHVHGNPPNHGIDHINGVKDDNRLCNLRDVTQSENVRNWWMIRKFNEHQAEREG